MASAGLDGLTPILLLTYALSAIGAGIYGHRQLSRLAESGQNVPPTSLWWTSVILGIVLLFAITGPMVLLGMFVASKIMKFPLSGTAYLEACGVSALPALHASRRRARVALGRGRRPTRGFFIVPITPSPAMVA